MAVIPKFDELQNTLDAGTKELPLRPYLGYSTTGGACKRKMYYDFRWAYTPVKELRIIRLWARGDHEEILVIEHLRSLGLKVFDEQKTVYGPHGHVLGHIDGNVLGVPDDEKTMHLLEVKTMNEKRYKEYLNKGLKFTNPSYYSQVNSYMGKQNLLKCLFIVVNKNTEQRSYRIVAYDHDEYLRVEEIALSILYAEVAPPRIGERTWFECKFCDAKEICHYQKPVDQNCRTCEHFTIEDKGEFACAHHNVTLTTEAQRVGCKDYSYDECLT